MTIINIADLKDPNDLGGRSYREVNNEKQHKYGLGDLVEIEGEKAFIARLGRDCDGTPLYSICMHGYAEESLKLVCKNPDTN